MLNKKYFILIMMGIFLIGLTSAQLDSLGTFKQNSEVRIAQVCQDATYINISSISYPNGTVAVSGIQMTSAGSGEYYYDFTDTSLLGRYDVRGISDGCEKTFATYFEVTLNGNKPAEGIVVVIFTIIFILIFGFGLIYFLKSIAHVIQFDFDLIDTAVMIATYLSMWMFYYFSYEYLGNAFINNILEVAISVGAVTHVILPLVSFMVSFIMTNLKFKQKQRTTY